MRRTKESRWLGYGFSRSDGDVRTGRGRQKPLGRGPRAATLSLPAVSRQLAALEAELGATLVVRSTRRLHVTEAGQRWYAHYVRLLREIDDARDAVRDSKLVHGTLVVSASLTFGSLVIVPRLTKLAETYPKLTVDLRLEDNLVDLVGEGVDVAVRAGSPPPDSTSFVAEPIFTMDRILVASPRCGRKNGSPAEPHGLAHRASGDCLVQVTSAGASVGS